jgi:hypothetical protein
MVQLDAEAILYRAKLTAQFLESPAWSETVEAVEAKIKTEWARTDTSAERREQLWQKYQAFQDLKRELRATRDRAKLDEPLEE